MPAALFWCFHNLFNPLCPRLPITTCSFFLLHDCLIVASNHTLHTESHANRNGILVRFVASFPLLSTTSGDVLCSKFGWVWEMLWIFQVVRLSHNSCTKINKSPAVSNGIRTSSPEIRTANFAQSLTPGTLTNSWSFVFRNSNWKFGKLVTL